jgi:hypothetical protein
MEKTMALCYSFQRELVITAEKRRGWFIGT